MPAFDSQRWPALLPAASAKKIRQMIAPPAEALMLLLKRG